MTVSRAMPFSRSRKRSSSIGIFTSPSSRCWWFWFGCGCASPRQHHLPLDHIGQRDPDLAAVDVEGDHLVVGVDDHAMHRRLTGGVLVGARRPAPDDADLVAALAAEVPAGAERPREPRR